MRIQRRTVKNRLAPLIVVLLGMSLATSSLRAQQPVVAPEERVSPAAFSQDGRLLAKGGGKIELWEVTSNALLRNMPGHNAVGCRGRSCTVLAVAFSPDGRWLASGSEDKTIKLWEAATGQEVRTLAGHTNGVMALAFSPDGRWLASGSKDKTIKLWEAATGQEVRTLAGHTGTVMAMAFSPDGRWLATGSEDNTIKLWEAATGQEVRTLKGHKALLWALAFSPDGSRLATGDDRGAVFLWEVASGRRLRQLAKAWETGQIEAITFSPDGAWLAASCVTMIEIWHLRAGTAADPHVWPGNTIRRWDVATGKEIGKRP